MTAAATQASGRRRSAPAPSPGPSRRRGPTARRRTSPRREAAAAVALLLLAVAVRLPTLDQPLIEHHDFRQTQTAYTALLFHQDGVDLLHPKLPVFGAPFEVPFEFPLFQAMAAGAMSWGLSADVAMRTTALACFVLSALLLWGLVRHVGGRTAALAALALYLFSPFALLWSRASMIEYLAVAGALGWVWAGLLWRDRRRAVHAVAALAAGVTALLVKPTTGALWVLPLLAYTAAGDGRGRRAWLRARLDPGLGAIVVLPFLAAMAWTGHADAIKAASPATEWLTSSRLARWNFGTLDQRLDLANWATVSNRVTTQLTGYPAWLLPLGALVGIRTRAAAFWAALAAVPVVTVLVFWNLYVVHDYYLAAISPALAALAGSAFARARHALAPGWARIRLAAVVGAGTAALLVVHPWVPTLAYRDVSVARAWPETAEAARLTRATDLVVFEGYDWAPVVPYYARRGGRMILAPPRERATAAELAAAGYRVVVTPRLQSDLAADTLRSGRWTGVLGSFVYLTADDPGDLRGAPVTATDDPVAIGAPLPAEPVTIACGRGTASLPRGTGPTVLRLAPGTPRSAKLSVAAGYGDVPVRDHVVLGPGTGEGPVAVGCRGAAAVTIVAAGTLA